MRRSEAAAHDPAVAWRLAPAERDRDPRRRTAGSLLAVLFLGTVVAPVAVPLFAAHAQIWDGYYLLGEEGAGGLDGASLERVFAGSVTPAAPVRFTMFGGFAEVPVDRLAQRLDPIDPRFDPFLRGVTGLFAASDPSGREWSLGYLRTDLPPAGLLLRLAFRAPAAARAVLDFDVRGRLLAAGLVAAVAVAAIGVRSVAGRPASGLGMAGIVAPWTVAALNAGGVAVIAAAAVVPALWRLPGPAPARAAGGAAAAVAVVVTASFLIAGALAGFAVSAASLGSIAATASSSARRTALPSRTAPAVRRPGRLRIAGRSGDRGRDRRGIAAGRMGACPGSRQRSTRPGTDSRGRGSAGSAYRTGTGALCRTLPTTLRTWHSRKACRTAAPTGCRPKASA